MATISTSQIDQTTSAIKSEISMIEQNRKHRNDIYQQCMDDYIQNLKKQIQMLESTDKLNKSRNQTISSAFQNVYEKVLTSANITLRKVKQTSYQKKLFWQDLIKNNSALNNLQLKKEFYMQKRDAHDRYLDAIDSQNANKIPYSVLLKKNPKKSELQQWKQNNRVFEEKVNQGTATLNQWKSNWQRNTQQAQQRNYRPMMMTQVYENLGQNNFIRTVSDQQLTNGIPIYESRANTNKYSSPKIVYKAEQNPSSGDFGFLKNFERKK